MKLTVPEHIGELTIGQFTAIHATTDPVEQVAIACGVTRDLITQLDLESLERVMMVMGDFDPAEGRRWPLVRTFELGAFTYGFNPNLSDISVGEYADIETLWKDVYANLPALMSVLYRPVTFRHKDHYQVEPYAGVKEHPDFVHVRMEVVLGALGFFLRCAMDSVTSLSQSLLEAKEAN